MHKCNQVSVGLKTWTNFCLVKSMPTQKIYQTWPYGPRVHLWVNCGPQFGSGCDFLQIVTHHMAAGERRACHTAPPLLETSSNWWVRLWGRPGEATARRFGLRHCFYITSTHDHCAVMHLTSNSMNTIDWTCLISLLADYLTTWLHNHMVTRSLALWTQGGMFAASFLDPNSWSHLDYRLKQYCAKKTSIEVGFTGEHLATLWWRSGIFSSFFVATVGYGIKWGSDAYMRQSTFPYF